MPDTAQMVQNVYGVGSSSTEVGEREEEDVSFYLIHVFIFS